MIYVNSHRQHRPSKSFQNATYHFKISSVLISKSSQLCVCFFLSIQISLLKISNLNFQNLFFIVMSLNFKIELLLINIFYRFMGITYFMLIFLLIKIFNIHSKNLLYLISLNSLRSTICIPALPKIMSTFVIFL